MALNTDRTPTPAADRSGGSPDLDASTDGRQLRRKRNRESVVEALLDLYRDGNLRPSTEEIAARSGLSPRSLFRYFEDVDDLTRAAIMRQEARAMPLVAVDVGPEETWERKVAALVEQRFLLFDAVGHAAAVTRLRAPFQPLLAAELSQNRRFLRSQVSALFAPEVAAMDEKRSVSTLAAIDILTSFESYQLLTEGRSMPSSEAAALVADALSVLIGPVH
ncbi:MAG: TetR/AcrR family transcriptional regulator [Acidimicrobiales bacterium]